MGFLRRQELPGVGRGRHPVPAFAFGGRTVEGVETVVEGVRGRGDVEFPVGDVREVQRLGEARLACLERPLGVGEPAFLVDLQEGAFHDGRQAVEHEVVLHQVVAGTELHHLHGHTFVAVAGDDDERTQPAGGAQLLDERRGQTIRQRVVDEQEIGLVRRQPLVTLLRVAGALAAGAPLLEQFAEEIGETFVVLDDEDAFGGERHGRGTGPAAVDGREREGEEPGGRGWCRRRAQEKGVSWRRDRASAGARSTGTGRAGGALR